MKDKLKLAVYGAVIAFGVVGVNSLLAPKPVTYHAPSATVTPAKPQATPTPTPLVTVRLAAPVAATAAPVSRPAATPVPTPVPTVDPECVGTRFTPQLIDQMLASMKTAGYSQKEIDDARFKANVVRGYQEAHCY